jgi:hypothetical protein
MYLEKKLGVRKSNVKDPKSPIPEHTIEPPKAFNPPIRIIYLWAMIFIAMALYVVTWFTLGLPVVYFINAIRTTVTFTDPMWEGVVDFVLICFEIHPIISLIGWFIYGILNSSKRDVDTWRTF